MMKTDPAVTGTTPAQPSEQTMATLSPDTLPLWQTPEVAVLSMTGTLNKGSNLSDGVTSVQS